MRVEVLNDFCFHWAKFEVANINLTNFNIKKQCQTAIHKKALKYVLGLVWMGYKFQMGEVWDTHMLKTTAIAWTCMYKRQLKVFYSVCRQVN